MTEWRDIKSAPKDGTPIRAKIEGYGGDNIIAWHEGFIDVNGNDCGCWCYLEGEPPECWSDGIYWEVNEDLKRSAQPTHWKPDQPPKDSQ